MATFAPERPRPRPTRAPEAGAPIGVVAAGHPLTGGAAPFNDAMVRALRRRGPVAHLGWRRMYPPFAYRGQATDERSRPPGAVPPERLLDWHNPLTWRAAIGRLDAAGARALVIPWLHPVMAPPTRWMLRHAPRGMRRVVICHNVRAHEPAPFEARLTRAALAHADLLVTHAAGQRAELAELGLGGIPLLDAFHPVFVAEDLALPPAPEAVARTRRQMGSPDLALLCFGAIRPYKGVELAVEAMALVDPAISVRLVVAGRFWMDRAPLEERIRALGLGRRVELRDGYLTNDEAAVLFEASDAALLPYRSASQSGVVGLAFAHGRPVIATSVGGLPEAVRHGVDGLLCPPDDPGAIAAAIERLAAARQDLAAGVAITRAERSFDRYADRLRQALDR